MNLSAYPFIKPADFIVLLISFLSYYYFLKTGFEVFTYKMPGKLYLLAVSAIAMITTLFFNIAIAFGVVVVAVMMRGINIKDSIIVALTAEFGFFIAFIALYFIFTTLGTMFGIEGLELNLDWDELLHFASMPKG
ncbi:hypothetical protein [Pyrococcus sp. ST04]|uniref:hypothetical protein n=1 Tax=Pyrococcus sp. ST04 TaxID=1183377 RepID=UPI0002605EAE|nr:hypothetical protein [Pyrococcus sp. ST04]AFK22602.1 hypothetical protein Py04_1022 [Pyrococcus sp. ST04]